MRINKKRLEEVLFKKNLTKRDFAERLGISVVYGYSLFNGLFIPGPKTREKLKKILKSDFNKIFDENVPY